MDGRCPLPARASFRDLLRDLLGQQVTIRPGPEQNLDQDAPSYLSGYRFDDGDVAALAVTDLTLSAALGAALGMMPAQETLEEVRGAKALQGDLVDFLHEVVNVTAKLLNSPTTPHVALRELAAVPGDVPEDIAGRAQEPLRRQDWQVEVQGFGEGLVTFLG